MAYTGKSAVVSDAGSSPVVFSNRYEQKGNVYKDYSFMSSVAANTVGQTYAFARLPKTASVRSVKLHGASTADLVVNVGLYRTDETTAIDDNCIGTLIAGTSFVANGFEVYDEQAVATRGLPLSEVFSTAISTAGATDDSYYDVVVKVSTAQTVAAGAIGLEVTYVL